MTESPTSPRAVVEAEDESPPSAPRWVKVFGIALLVLLVVALAMHLTGHAPMAAIHGS